MYEPVHLTDAEEAMVLAALPMKWDVASLQDLASLRRVIELIVEQRLDVEDEGWRSAMRYKFAQERPFGDIE